MDQRRVVISGIGVVSGLGIGVGAFWEGLLVGRSAVGPVKSFDASEFPVRLAAEVEDSFRVRDYVPKSYRKAVKVMCRDIELAVVAAATAIDDGGLRTNWNLNGDDESELTYEPARFGCQIGAGLIVADIDEITSAFATAESEPGNPDSFSLKNWGTTGMENLTPLWLLKFLPNMLACHVTIVHDCRGPSNTITCTEVAGGLSVGEARRVIERGDADICFAGGAESKVNPLGMLRQSFTGMMAETTAEDDANPAGAVQPFAKGARGSVPGEGGALLLIEDYELAKGRGGKIYAEVVGFGAAQSFDLKSGKIDPGEGGQGLVWAIEQAFSDAGVSAEVIDAIVPMGFGASAYDLAEADALRAIFGERLVSVPLVTTKPNVGSCAAGAGAIDLAAGAMCLHHQMLPARLGCAESKRMLDGIDAGETVQRDSKLEYLLVCGMGLGGQNTAVVLKKV